MDGDKFNYSCPMMPDGNGGHEPVPPAMDDLQFARYIGLQVKNPKAAVKRLRKSGQVTPKKVGRSYRYTAKMGEVFLNGED